AAGDIQDPEIDAGSGVKAEGDPLISADVAGDVVVGGKGDSGPRDGDATRNDLAGLEEIARDKVERCDPDEAEEHFLVDAGADGDGGAGLPGQLHKGLARVGQERNEARGAGGVSAIQE